MAAAGLVAVMDFVAKLAAGFIVVLVSASGAFYLATLLSRRVADFWLTSSKHPLGSEAYYVAGAGACAVLLVAAVIAANKLSHSVFFEDLPGWLPDWFGLIVVVVSLATVVVLGLALWKSFGALRDCHPASNGARAPSVCGTSQDEAYVQAGALFGVFLLLLQVGVGMVAKGRNTLSDCAPADEAADSYY